MRYTEVVSQVVPAGFADLAGAAEQLPGSEARHGRARLGIQGEAGTSLPGMVRLAGTLRTGSVLVPRVKVEVVVTPWSAGRAEVAIHPISHLGRMDSLRARRFCAAARSVLPTVIDSLHERLPVDMHAVPALAA